MPNQHTVNKAPAATRPAQPAAPQAATQVIPNARVTVNAQAAEPAKTPRARVHVPDPTVSGVSAAQQAAGPHRPEPATPRQRVIGNVPVQQAARKTPLKRIKVMATQDGFYDNARRRTGDVFWITEDQPGLPQFSDTWMVLVDPATPVKVTTGKEALKKHHDERLGGQAERIANATEAGLDDGTADVATENDPDNQDI